MYIYIHMYICIYVYMYICIYVYMCIYYPWIIVLRITSELMEVTTTVVAICVAPRLSWIHQVVFLHLCSMPLPICKPGAPGCSWVLTNKR